MELELGFAGLRLVSDEMTDGRRFRILTVVDNCTRDPGLDTGLALVADTSISGLRVARELDRLVQSRGRPQTIVSDNGTEFTSDTIVNAALEVPRTAEVKIPTFAG